MMYKIIILSFVFLFSFNSNLHAGIASSIVDAITQVFKGSTKNFDEIPPNINSKKKYNPTVTIARNAIRAIKHKNDDEKYFECKNTKQITFLKVKQKDLYTWNLDFLKKNRELKWKKILNVKHKQNKFFKNQSDGSLLELNLETLIYVDGDKVLNCIEL